MKQTNLVFICSPYRGDTKRNTAKAKEYARFAALCGKSPVVPHLLFPQFLDDDSEDERKRGIELGLLQMKQCDEMWIFGTVITSGMNYEVQNAKEQDILIRLFDSEMKRIDPSTLKVDARVDDAFVRAVNGLKFVSSMMI